MVLPEKPANEAQEKKFLEAVDRLYLHDKRRQDTLRKLVEEKDKKSTEFVSSRPRINQQSNKILERKLKGQLDRVKNGEANDQEDLREYYQAYMMKDK